MSSARSIMWGWRCRFSLALQEPEITTYPVPLTSPVIIGDTAGATFCASIQEPGRPDRKHFPKEDFHIELEAGSCTCPAGNVTRRIRPLGTRTAATGRTHQLKAFQFDGAVCGVCPLRTQVRRRGAGHRTDGATAPAGGFIATGPGPAAE